MSHATQFEQDYSELSADITSKIGRIPSLVGKDKHDLVSSNFDILVLSIIIYWFNVYLVQIEGYTLCSSMADKRFN